jgi:hypothetical protein
LIEKPGDVAFYHDEDLVWQAYEICRNNNFTVIPNIEDLAKIPKLWLEDIFTAARMVRRQKQYNESLAAPPETNTDSKSPRF